MKIVVAIALIGVVLASGCVWEDPKERLKAETACILLCKLGVERGDDLSKGPCLNNAVVAGWVCDVVHNPRLEVDDKLENQCPEFGQTARHLVEVDEYCEIIRSI